MADKRNIRKNLKRIETIKTWQLVVLFVLAVVVSATFLRLNNTGMIARRNAIEGVDKSGDLQAVTSRVYDLQRYASSHMNADTGVFYLQAQYDRDVKQAVKGDDESTGDNSPQAKADAICNPNLQIHGYSKAYQDCMLAELSKAGQVVDPASIKLPNPALYRYSFNSPLWSSDFAGWSVLITLVILLMIFIRMIIWTILKVLIKLRYRQA